MTLPTVKARVLEGRKGLIVGIANDSSIAWGCARAFRAFGAELAITYLNDKARKYVEPLARQVEAPIFMPLDVSAPGQLEAVFDQIARNWGSLDFLVHSIAFSPRDTLAGRVTDAPRDGFLTTMDISCWSFIRMAQLAEPLMKNGGSLFTMTYYGSQKVVENYNIMGVAKAALEGAVRYMAAELGPKGHSRPCDFPGTARNARRVGHSGVRRASCQSGEEVARARAGRYRRCRGRDGVPRARCRTSDYRAGLIRRRRIPCCRLMTRRGSRGSAGRLSWRERGRRSRRSSW